MHGHRAGLAVRISHDRGLAFVRHGPKGTSGIIRVAAAGNALGGMRMPGISVVSRVTAVSPADSA